MRDEKGRFLKGIKSFRKGMNLEEQYGEERAKQIKEKMRLAKKDYIPWHKGLKGIHLNPEFEFKPGETRGNKNPHWKGGRRMDSKGYVLIWQPKHPYSNSKGYIAEHRLIAEKALGRYLKFNEIVHHINEKKDDNRNSNLLICSKSYHTWLHHKIREKGERL